MKNASTDFSSSAARIATTTTSWSRLKGFEGNLSASKLNETIHRGRRDTPPFERNIRRAIILRHERNDFDKIRRRQNRLLIVHKRFPIFRKKKKKNLAIPRFIEILGKNLSARFALSPLQNRGFFLVENFYIFESNRKCWKERDLKYNRRGRIFQSNALATLSRLKECR